MRRWGNRLVIAATGLALVALGTSGVGAAAHAAVAGTTPGSAVNGKVFTAPIKLVGTVDLTTAAGRERRSSAATTAGKGSGTSYRIADDRAATHEAGLHGGTAPAAATTALTTTNVAGERGFVGLTGIQQAHAFGGTDLEPPDQGLCAGNGYVMEFINNAVAVYTTSSDEVVTPVGSAAVFLQPADSFFSDPRCYYDSSTQRWFLQEFIVGTTNSKGKEVTPSTEFVAVSDNSDPTGNYHVYGFDTTDTAAPGCPCFGDYDQLGADANGIYITTDEFGVSSPAFNGVVAYAISKADLETFPSTGIPITVFGYRITADPFGTPYLLAPASTPAGGRFAPDTEYFVESDGNAGSDDRLAVYALGDTSQLAAPAPPTLYRVTIHTERYSVPVNAKQKPGPRPLGHQYQAPAGGIEPDFDSEMEPTYANGMLYAELNTLTSHGTDGTDWFILHPTLSASRLGATVVHQGLVSVAGTSLLYPYTALDSKGVGYLLFSLSGTSNYPSPAYIRYGRTGPTGPVIIAYPGAAPEDSFTCYSAFVGPSYGGCRWGDYSMGVAADGRIYMAAEMVPPDARDLLTNWGTYIWSAPPPSP